MWRVGYRDGWCVLTEGRDPQVVSRHPTRAAALDGLRALYDVDPVYAGLDWAENRIVASAALRWQRRYDLGGVPSALMAAARLADPTPLTAQDIAILDALTRSFPPHRHLSRDMAGRAWPRTAAVSRKRLRALSADLAAIDKRLGDRLWTLSTAAMREALRRAGVKAKVRAKRRGKAAQQAAADQKLDPAVLVALGVSADELLDRAFESVRVDATEAIRDANRRRARAVAATFDVDPEDLEDDPRADHRAEIAAGLLTAWLLGRARNAISNITPDVREVVPFAGVRQALRARDGWTPIPTVPTGPGAGGDLGLGEVTMIPPASDAIDELLGKVAPQSNFVRGFEWVHDYFGSPKTPFPPHEALDGAQYTDDDRDVVLAADPSEWPYVAVYSTDDHPDCCCWEIINYEPEDGL